MVAAHHAAWYVFMTAAWERAHTHKRVRTVLYRGNLTGLVCKNVNRKIM